MAINEIHLEDIVDFDATIRNSKTRAVIDLSAATKKDIIFEKDDGTVVTQAGSFITDGTDGQLRYTTSNTDLDRTGPWRWQANVIGPGYQNRSDIKQFTVEGNL